jgi:Calcineurin-like phosphoesterase/Bacterial Ig domain/Putative Ig domain
MTSGPSYAATVCFTQPVDGATLTGDASITASVSVNGIHPGIQKVVFRLDGGYLLTGYSAPYTFSLPTDRFVDGARVLEVEAVMRDGFVTQRSSVDVTFSNGITEPPVNNNTFTPATGTTPDPGRPFVLAATGDGASGRPDEQAVTNLISSWSPNLFLYTGDVYEKGSPTEFYNWYGTSDRFYGRFRDITNPTIGNHENLTPDSDGYFDYWDNIPHYFSVNVAGWHIVSLDSTGVFAQTTPSSAQHEWLDQDLSSSSADCTIAFFHHPRWSVGQSLGAGDAARMANIWSLLAEHGVDIVLNGHDHNYQRWQPLDASGTVKTGAPTEFVVGSGGHGIQTFAATDPRMVRGFDSAPEHFGALRFELNRDGAAFQFVNTQGATLDSGSVPCSGAPADDTPPSPPTNLSAVAAWANQVDLTWTSSTDNVGVTGYDIYRDDQLIARAGPATTYTDNTVDRGTTYEYVIRARDATGRVSGWSNTASVTTPLTNPTLFSDGFETGDMSQWTTSVGLVVQQQEVTAGSYAARGTSTGAATYAYKQLGLEQAEVYYRLRFKFISRGSNTVNLLKFRTAANGSILGAYVSNTGKLGYRNDVSGASSTSTTTVPIGAWHDLQVRLRIDGSAGEVETWFNGVRIPALSKTENLGTTAIGRIQLGDTSSGRTYDVAFDEVAVEPSPTGDPTTPEPITLRVTDGFDQKKNKTLVEDGNKQVIVNSSDNKRLEVEAGYYTAFQFEKTVPTGTTIQSVKVNVEHHEEDKLSPSIRWGVVFWPEGQTDPSVNQTISLTPTSSPGLLYGDKKEATVPWDVSAWIDTVEEANDFWFFVRNDSTNGKKTRLDQIYVVVTYSQGVESPKITSTPVTEASVGQPYTYEATATGTQPITWSIVSGPSGLTIDPNTGVVSWTPNGAGSFGVQIKARNSAGGDTQGYTLVVPLPPQGTLFADGFETGDLSLWSTSAGLVVQQQEVTAGSFGARGTSNGSATYAYKQLGAEQSDVYYRIRFKLISQGANTVNLLKFRTAANGSILGVYVTSTGKLGYRNDVAGVSTNTTIPVALGVWHDLQIRVRIDGAAGQTETWMDGVRIDALSKTESLGTSMVGRLQLGDTSSGRTYDVAFDEIAAATSFIGA